MPKIIVTLKPDGSSEIEAKGYKGSGCATETKFLRDALGEAVSESKKVEFYSEDDKKVHKVVMQDSGE